MEAPWSSCPTSALILLSFKEPAPVFLLVHSPHNCRPGSQLEKDKCWRFEEETWAEGKIWGFFKTPSVAMGLRKTPATSHCRLNESRGSLENVPTKLGRGTWPRFGELKTFPNGKPKVTTSEDQKERGQKRRPQESRLPVPKDYPGLLDDYSNHNHPQRTSQVLSFPESKD